MRHTTTFAAVLLAIGLVYYIMQPRPVVTACQSGQTQWSETQPPINLTHLFCGVVKGDGTLSGYHAIAGFIEEGEAVVAEIYDQPNEIGVYTGQVCMAVPGTDPCKFSSLFPDSWSAEQIVTAIVVAYDASGVTSGKWRGPSGDGFDIEGWLSDDGTKITTAYPIYE